MPRSTLFPLLLAPLLFLAAPCATAQTTYEALVVVKVEGLDDGALARLASEVGKDRRAGLEYSCVWSGIVVLKFSGITTGDRADVATLARRLFTGAGITTGTDLLHVHAEARGPGKC